MSSAQLDRYLRLRRDDTPVAEAAAVSGIGIAEAKLTEQALAKGELQFPQEKIMEGTNVSADQLRLFIERIERLEEEKKGIGDDIKDVYGEAKATGFDTKTIRTIVRLRKMEKHARDEQAALLETYCRALGMQYSLPLAG